MPDIGEILGAIGKGMAATGKGVLKAAPYAIPEYRNVMMQQYAAMQGQEREMQRRQKEALKTQAYNRAADLAKLGLVDELPLLEKHLDPQVYQTFVSQAQQTQEQQVADFVKMVQSRLIEQPPGEFVPYTAGGETQALVTPTGAVVSKGQPGVIPQVQFGAGGAGGMERTINVSEKGGISQKYTPTPEAKIAGKRERAGSKWITQTSQFLRERFDMDPTSARILSAHMARDQGMGMEKTDQTLLDYDRPAVPGVAEGVPGPVSLGIEQKGAAQQRVEGRKRIGTRTFINPSTFEELPSNMRVEEAWNQGAKEVDTATKRALAASRKMDAFIDEIEEVVNILFTTDDEAEAARNALNYSKKGFFREGSRKGKAITKLQAFKARAGQLAREISAESGGRLSDQDIMRVFEAIPGLRGVLMRETKGTAQQLISDMRKEAVGTKRTLIGLTAKPQESSVIEVAPNVGF